MEYALGVAVLLDHCGNALVYYDTCTPRLLVEGPPDEIMD